VVILHQCYNHVIKVLSIIKTETVLDSTYHIEEHLWCMNGSCLQCIMIKRIITKISSNNDAVRYQKESLAETKHLKTDI